MQEPLAGCASRVVARRPRAVIQVDEFEVSQHLRVEIAELALRLHPWHLALVTTRGPALRIFLHIEDGIGVASHDLLGGLEGICLATQFLTENVECQPVHLQLTVINVSEEKLLLRHKRLSLLDLAKSRVLMFEHNGHKAGLKCRWGQAVKTLVTPECSGGCKSISKNNLHARIKATSQ